jgi:uncharacterized protein (TIGR02099 family)
MLKTEQSPATGKSPDAASNSVAPGTSLRGRSSVSRAFVWGLGGVFFVAILGFLVVRLWVWPELQRWQPQVEAQLSKALGAKVTVGSLEPAFRGVYPSLVATNLTTVGGELSLARVEMEFSPRALLARQLVFRHLNLESGQIRIEVDDKGLWHIAGLVFDPADRSVMDEASKQKVSDAMRWMLEQRQLKLSNVMVTLTNKTASRKDQLDISEVTLTNNGRSHDLKAIAYPGGVFEANWNHSAGVASDLPKQWFGGFSWQSGNGEKAIKGEFLSYLLRSAQVVKNAPVLEQLSGLTFQGNVEATFAKGIIDSIQLRDVALSSSGLLATVTTPLVKLRRVAGQDFEIQTNAITVQGVESLTGLRLGVNGPSNIRFHWGAEELGAEFATLHSAKVQLGPLDVAAAAAAVRRWASVQSVVDIKSLLTKAGLNNWLLAGRVNGGKVSWDDAADELSGEFDAQQLSLLGVDRASVKPAQISTELPGFEGISGKFSFEKVAGSKDFEGKYEVAGDQSRLVLPNVFSQPEVKFSKLKGTGTWHWFRDAGEEPSHIFELTFNKIDFANADGSGSVKGVYRAAREPKRPGYADISGTLDKATGIRIANYLPIKINELTRSWIAKAIKAGDATDGTFKLKGDLWNFPFREPGSGEFSIFAKVKNAQFAFAPNWAEIENINGDFLLDKTSIRVNGKRATVQGVPVSDVVVDLPDLRTGVVKISGKADGSVADMLNFVNTSPLKRLTVESENNGIKEFTESLKLEGPAQLTLAIELPIFDFTNVKVQGLVSLSNGQLKSMHTPNLRSVEGSLAFTEKTLELKTLSGIYGDLGLGQNYPLTLSGASDSNLPLALRISGVASSEALKKLPLLQGVLPLLNSLDGAAEFDSVVEINREAFQVQVQSGLNGMALALPAPIGKAAEQTRGFRLSYTPTNLVAGLKPISGAAEVESPQVELKISRKSADEKNDWFGGLNIGRLNGEPMAEATEGLSAIVKTDRLNINDWRQWISKTFPLATSDSKLNEQQNTYIGIPSFSLNGSALKVNHLALSAKEVIVEDILFKDPVIGATLVWQALDTSLKTPNLLSWQATVKTNQANGYLNWVANSANNSVFARLAALQWPLSGKEIPVTASPSSPREPTTNLPSLDIVSDTFTLNGTLLGGLKLLADASKPASYDVADFTLTMPEVVVKAQGAWNKADNLSRFKMAAVSQDTGALLSTVGQPGILKSGPGEIKGDIRWRGNVDAFAFSGLSGDVSLEMGKGQFLKTDVGAARMLGLFSVQGLMRRLNLDFRDVAAEGFAFDSIAGPIKINDGIALPDDVLIKSPIAQISFKGQLDIALRTQDLTLKVVPEVNAGAASLAYAAWVNPAIGLGTFIFQWALRKPLQSIFTTEYSVSGQWNQPLIKGFDRKLSQYRIAPSE